MKRINQLISKIIFIETNRLHKAELGYDLCLQGREMLEGKREIKASRFLEKTLVIKTYENNSLSIQIFVNEAIDF